MPDINTSDFRTFVYEDSFFQLGDTPNTLIFIQEWVFHPSMDDFDIDKIDTADPIYTKKSDILGTFSFNTKNTVDIYDTAVTPTNDETISYWIVMGIAKGIPTKVTFIQILNAAASSNPTDKVTIEYTGRVMDVTQTRNRNTGVHELEVIGEITAIAKVQREFTTSLKTTKVTKKTAKKVENVAKKSNSKPK